MNNACLVAFAPRGEVAGAPAGEVHAYPTILPTGVRPLLQRIAWLNRNAATKQTLEQARENAIDEYSGGQCNKRSAVIPVVELYPRFAVTLAASGPPVEV